MSEHRKCVSCSRPADFLSSRCPVCHANHLKSAKHYNDKKREKRLQDPKYVNYRKGRLKRMEKRLEGPTP